MKTALFRAIAVSVFVGLAASALAGATAKPWTFGAVHRPIQGTNYMQALSAQDQAGLVRWNPENEPPPIPLAEAIRRAKQFVESRFPDQAWRFSGSDLHSSPMDPSIWHYTVFIATADAKFGDADYNYFTLFVAPDGWIPELVPREPGHPK